MLLVMRFSGWDVGLICREMESLRGQFCDPIPVLSYIVGLALKFELKLAHDRLSEGFGALSSRRADLKNGPFPVGP